MKNTLSLFISSLFFGFGLQALAQSNLSFDPQFNSGNPHGFSAPYVYQTNSGRMRQLNDSMYVYFRSVNNGTDLIQSDVLGKVVHASGAVTEFVVYSKTDTTNQFDRFMITDLIANGSNGSLYVIKNKGGYEVEVIALSCNPSLLPANPWSLNSTYGTAGIFTIGTTISLSNAMGANTSNGLILFAEKPGMSRRDLYRIQVDGSNGGAFIDATITAANMDQYHTLRDVIAINDSTFAVADDYSDYILNTVSTWYEYHFAPRIYKVTLTDNAPGYTSVGVNYTSTYMEKTLNRIFLDSQDKLWVLGTNKIPGQFGWSYRGYAQGIIDFSTVTTNLTLPYSPPTVDGSSSYSLFDIKENPYTPGEYLLSGSTGMGMVARFQPNNGTSSQITPVYISDTTLNIYQVNWFYVTPTVGANANNAQVVFHGTTYTGVLGRLEPGSAVGLEDLSNTNLLIYPNPAQDVIHLNPTIATPVTIRSLDGTVVYSAQIDVPTTIKIDQLAAGVYVVQTADGQTQRFIKY